ncbi:hypothetical protein GCM10009849_25830 [Sinomonas flava]|uniref:Uncharacterized protein n=1 Tax=Sinomonas flava TaxID=496857 RepID=A0ABN3BXE5_9MICC
MDAIGLASVTSLLTPAFFGLRPSGQYCLSLRSTSSTFRIGQQPDQARARAGQIQDSGIWVVVTPLMNRSAHLNGGRPVDVGPGQSGGLISSCSTHLFLHPQAPRSYRPLCGA